MKVGVLNFSGNVGKSTVARHLLAPRMNNAFIQPIETINSDGNNNVEALSGKKFAELQVMLQTRDDLVVDIGASNVEDFIKKMSQYRGSQEDFDFFVIPVVPASKQQRDTIATVEALAELGVPANKIRLLFNQVEMGDSAESVFSSLFNYQKSEKRCLIRKDAVIHLNEIYPKFASTDKSIAEILADETDYKQKIKDSTNPDDKSIYAQRIGLKRLAAGVTEELDLVFKALFH